MSEVINQDKENYAKAEQLANEIVEICITKGITLREFQLLRTALPNAINNKVAEVMSNTKLS